MIQVISARTFTARKPHRCDGYEEILEWIYHGCMVEKGVKCKYNKVSFSDYRTIVKWKNDINNFLILPGMIYERQFNKMDGEAYTFKMRKDMYDIFCKYDLWCYDN